MSSSSSSSSSSSTDSSGSSSDSSSSDTEQSAGSQRSAPRSPGKSPKQQPQQAERRKSSGSSAPAKPTSRSDAQAKSASRKVSSTTGGAAAARSSSTSAAPPARSTPKSPVRRAAADSKTAKKSIFSPDESSASEPESKPNAKQASKNKSSRRPNGSAKNSSVSSSRACSGVDSGSSSAAEEADGASAAGSARLPATTAPPKQSGTPGTAAAAAGSSDSEAVRRRTRSARPSRSQMKRSAIYNTDSESETADSQQGTKGPRKKKRAGGGSGAPARPVADQPPPQRAPTMGEGGCPVPGCDSRGHLSGLYERHFTRMACPLYHRTTDAQAKDHQLEREIRTSDRQRALNKYRAGQTTPEQKSYMSRVTSQRRQAPENTERKPETIEEDRSREIELDSLAPSYDVALFREAQAAASAHIEDNLRHLPDTPGLHSIEMGRFDMEVWYQSPYPDDFPRGSKMFICQYCLKYLRCRTSLERHNAKCVWRFPPGDEIYRKDALSVFEVDGRRFKGYCQNLCLLAKLFLDNKTLYFDVEPFLFYVMTVADSEGCHVVGYFSKEKNSFLNYNVSCIMTLPPYQRQGYGRLLIDFSYLLTKTENKIGSPEKPLSDLGLISYRSYWKDALLRYLSDFRGKVVSIKDISQEMAANSNDIVSTLQAVGIVKYWKNKHIILKRQDIFEDFEEKRSRRGPDHKEIDPKCLTWKPFQAPEQNKSS